MIAVRVLYNDAILNRSSRTATATAIPGVRMSTSTAAEINDMDGMPAYCRVKDHYQAGDPLLEVLQFDFDMCEATIAKDAANFAFELLNIRHPEGWAHRSMCVGDIVVVGEVALVCASFGWEFVDISTSEVKVA